MAIRHFTELDAWRLADQLETEVIQLVQSTSANRDFKYRDELLEALSSVPSNIAEGFTRKSPRDECGFFDFALGKRTVPRGKPGRRPADPRHASTRPRPERPDET